MPTIVPMGKNTIQTKASDQDTGTNQGGHDCLSRKTCHARTTPINPITEDKITIIRDWDIAPANIFGSPIDTSRSSRKTRISL